MYLKKFLISELPTPFLRELFVTLVVGVTAFLDGFTHVFIADEEVSGDANKTPKTLADSVNTFSKILGCILFTQISNFFGRKISILLIYLMYLLTFVFIGLDHPSAFLTSQILAGIASGGKSIVILYVSEMSSTGRRISFLYLLSTLWTFGFFVIVIAQHQISVLFTVAIISVISLIGFSITCFIPESKYWYAIQKDYENTRASILWFNKDQLPANTAKEIDEITEVRDDKTYFGDIYSPVKHTGIEQFSYSVLLLLLCITSQKAADLIIIQNFLDMCHTLGVHSALEVKTASCLGVSIIALILVDGFKRKSLVTWICSTLLALFLALITMDFGHELNFNSPKWLQISLFLILDATINSFLLPLGTILTVEIISKSTEKRCSILGLLYIVIYLWQGVCLPHLSMILVELGLISLVSIFILMVILIVMLVRICIPETWTKALHYCLS